MTLTPALQEALNDAISSGKFIDTKVVLYSRRDSSGRVCKPKALYANSHVLKSVPYFSNREFPPCPLHGVWNDPSPEVLSGAFSESEMKDFSEAVDDGEFAEDYGYSSDSDLEEDWDFRSPAPPEDWSKTRQREALYGQYKEHIRMGMVIRVQDVAFITYVHPLSNFLHSQRVKAFLLSCFIYTPIRSLSRRLDPKKIASQGVLRLLGNKREKYLDRRQNQSTGWRTRFQTLVMSLAVAVNLSV